MKLVNASTGKVPEAPIPGAIRLILPIAEALPDGHYLTSAQAAAQVGRSRASLVNHFTNTHIRDYLAPSPEHPRGLVLCNKKTAKFIRESKP